MNRKEKREKRREKREEKYARRISVLFESLMQQLQYHRTEVELTAQNIASYSFLICAAIFSISSVVL